MSQFGWQFETRIVSTTGGNQALMEWLVLLGGLEQDERSLPLAWLAGYRMAKGLERRGRRPYIPPPHLPPGVE